MRQLLPLRRLVEVVLEPFGLERTTTSEISMVWEDNSGVIGMVEGEYPNMTPRSKHIAVKYHWFRRFLKPDTDGTPPKIFMKKIDTKNQKADIYTKGLGTTEYKSKRKMMSSRMKLAYL